MMQTIGNLAARASVAKETWALEVQNAFGARLVIVGQSSVIVGSSRSADVVLDDCTVSSRHCEIRPIGEGIAIRDLDSAKGTYIGGARIKEAIATPGTTLAVGQSSIVCRLHHESDDNDYELGEPLPGVAGASTAMRRIAAQVRRLAKLSVPVMVIGETGVGKELIVRALHTEGPRQSGPFVAINVSALPRELVESELFGHERGSFTGAVSRRVGAFTEAAGGTLFLDEIGELPIDAQPKLLRALDGYEVRRVGSTGSGRREDVRVVTATHVILSEKVGTGGFRRDLFHRLEALVIEIPPLRERRGDIVPIARHWLATLENDFGRLDLTPEGIATLTAHDWPGNARDVRNVLLRAAVLAQGRTTIDAGLIERAIRRPRQVNIEITPEAAQIFLDRCRGNLSAAARAAGIARTTFRSVVLDSQGQRRPRAKE